MSLSQTQKIWLGLLIGGISGTISFFIGMPLPWMLGSMIGVTIAAIAGAPVAASTRLRTIVVPVIGVMIGSSVGPDTFSQIGLWTTTLVVLPFALVIVAGFSYVVYRRIGRYDPVTAFYASMPGGLNEMMMLGEEAGGDERKIALAHAARVLLVIFMVALIYGLLFQVTSGRGGFTWLPLTAITPRDYVILALCAVVGAWGARQIRMPAGAIFGPMILSGIAHVAGWVTVAPPTLLIVLAQVVIGTVIGSRFVGIPAHIVFRELVLAAIATAGMLLLAFGAAVFTAWLTGFALTQVFLAFAPGGVTEMTLLSLAIGKDAAFVSVIHLIRITLVIALAPYLFRFARRAGYVPGDPGQN